MQWFSSVALAGMSSGWYGPQEAGVYFEQEAHSTEKGLLVLTTVPQQEAKTRRQKNFLGEASSYEDFRWSRKPRLAVNLWTYACIHLVFLSTSFTLHFPISLFHSLQTWLRCHLRQTVGGINTSLFFQQTLNTLKYFLWSKTGFPTQTTKAFALSRDSAAVCH